MSTDGMMVDVVFDVTGSAKVLASAVQMARQLGRVVLVGDTPTPSRQMLGPGVVSESIAILGVHGSLFKTSLRPEITDLFFRFVERGNMRVAPMVAERHSPADAAAVYARLGSGDMAPGAVCFDWGLLPADK